MEQKTKIVLTEVKDSQFEKSIKNAEKILTSLDKDLEKISKVMEKADTQTRFFIADGLVGMILNASKLPSYILSSIASKYFLMGQLPHLLIKTQKAESADASSYIG